MFKLNDTISNLNFLLDLLKSCILKFTVKYMKTFRLDSPGNITPVQPEWVTKRSSVDFNRHHIHCDKPYELMK